MRPFSFNHHMSQGRNFNQFPGFGPGPIPRPPRPPRHNFGQQPPPHPGMRPQGFNQPKGSTPKLDSFMDTANRFLATAQSFQPLIQQATPMIRNLPAIWKLYKGFQSTPDTNEKQSFLDEDDSLFLSDYEQQPEIPERRSGRNHRNPRVEREREVHRETRPRYSSQRNEETRGRKVQSQPSVPRIFQPPYNFD